MFCMKCGQQLPDGAMFCFRCGSKTFSEESQFVGAVDSGADLPVNPAESAEPAPQPSAEPIPQPSKEPVPQPTPQPQPAPGPAKDPARMPVVEPEPAWGSSRFAGGPKLPRAPRIPRPSGASGASLPPPSKKLIAAVAGVVAVVAILAYAMFGDGSSADGKPEIPDPEYYFALPLSSTEEEDGLVTYTIKADDDADLSDQVHAYVDLLRSDYGFLVSTNEEDEGYIKTFLMSVDGDVAEVVVIYLNDSYGNKIVVTTTRNVSLVSGVSYEGPSAGSTSASSDEGRQPAASYATGDLSVLPDFTEFDSTGTFGYSTAFFASTKYEVDRLYISFSSKDVNAVYEANRYVEMLYDLGWQLEFIGEDDSFYLYHPDVDAPSLPDAERAQIYVHGHVNSTGDTAFVSFMLPEEICIKNYEDKWQWNVEWREKREAEKAQEEASSGSSSSSSSSGSSSSSTPSYNRDLYDNDPICGVCNGDGDCSKCGGSGYLWSSASDEKDRNCYKCSGSGRCGSCGGDGRL